MRDGSPQERTRFTLSSYHFKNRRNGKKWVFPPGANVDRIGISDRGPIGSDGSLTTLVRYLHPLFNNESDVIAPPFVVAGEAMGRHYRWS